MYRLFVILIYSIIFYANLFAQQDDLERAKQLINQEKYLDAAKLLRPLAEKGNPQAQYLAAELFAEGKGVVNSIEQAEKYYLLAANNGIRNAAIKLCEIYDKTNRSGKSSQLLVNLCEKYRSWEDTEIGLRLGYYYFTGHGNLETDKLLGWGMLYRSRHNLGNSGNAFLEKLKNEFYSYLLETEEPNLLCQYFGYYYWKYMSKPEWAANYLDDVAKKIMTLPYEKQTEHLKAWEKERLTSGYKDASAVVLAMMYAEGIGCTKDIVKAKEYYSAMSEETHELLYNHLYKHMDSGKDGHLNKNDFPNFVQVVEANYNDRIEKVAFEKRIANIKAHTTLPQITARFMNATWDNGTLRVSFIITTEAVNSSKITIDSYGGVSCIDADGKRLAGEVDIWGETNALTKGKEGYVSAVFKDMPSSGELKSVSVSLQSQYRKGFINATDVEWNMKYQGSSLTNATTNMQQKRVVHDVVEEMPEYIPGLQKYLAATLKYPSNARKDKVEGEVLVKFVVETDGRLTNVQIIKGLNPYLDKEAIRVISGMPKWKSGKVKGKAVPTYVTIPVVFKL